MNTDFGKLLSFKRLARGYSQVQLAVALGFLDPSLISKYERGTRNPDRITIISIARILELSNEETNDLLSIAGYAPINDYLKDITEKLQAIEKKLEDIQEKLKK